jgi:hypothetical protein
MRRLLFAVGTLGAIVVLAAAPAWAVKAGDNCSAADAQAGTVTTSDSGTTLKCVATATGLPQWTTVVGGTTNATTATTAPALTTTTVGATATSATTGMATTGLNHTRQFVEMAIVFLGLGTAIVLEVRARNGLDRLHLQRLMDQLPAPARRSTRREPH